MKIWTCGALHEVGPEMPERGSKRHRCQSSEQLLEFLLRDPNDFLSGAIGDLGRNLVISL